MCSLFNLFCDIWWQDGDTSRGGANSPALWRKAELGNKHIGERSRAVCCALPDDLVKMSLDTSEPLAAQLSVLWSQWSLSEHDAFTIAKKDTNGSCRLIASAEFAGGYLRDNQRLTFVNVSELSSRRINSLLELGQHVNSSAIQDRTAEISTLAKRTAFQLEIDLKVCEHRGFSCFIANICVALE